MSNEWKRPAAPPSPMFTGEKEREFIKHINDEIQERVIGQSVLYFPIDVENSYKDDIYYESIDKLFLAPIQCYGAVEWLKSETVYEKGIAIDQKAKIEVKFERRRMTEDKNLIVKVGDFLKYGELYFEIKKITVVNELFGQQDQKYEISCSCIQARSGLFNGK
jgi:hypothetical protein